MSSSREPARDWIDAWIEGQKVALAKWSFERPPSGAPQFRTFSDIFSPALAAAQSALGARAASGVPDSLGFLWRMPGSPASGGAGSAWDMPGVGPLREQQAAVQEMAAALADVERLSLEMAGVIAKIHADTLDLLARRAAEQANEGKPVGDAKALYELWIECGEATYAKVAHSDAYCRLQADLCNAGIRFQSSERQQMERWLKLLDLPTRAEVNTLNQRIRELQRQLEAAAAGEPSASLTPARPSAPRRKVAQKRSVSRAVPAGPKRKPRPKS